MSENKYIIGAHAYHAARLEPALYLVSTPIGNLGDMTIRGIETLAAADMIVCEDSRVTRVLLERFGIFKRPITYHEHNAKQAGPQIVAALLANKSVALVSDAGTPLISDPGFKLVEEAHKENIKVIPIPGASAVLSALVASGLPTDSFFFAGFLSAKKSQRLQRLEDLKNMPATMVFYESPHRVSDTLADMVQIFGEKRKASLCRELTKKFETIDVATLAELALRYNGESTIRGEIVLVIEQELCVEQAMSAKDIDALLLNLAKELPTAKAANEAAKMTGLKKQDLFSRLIVLKE